MEWTRKFPFSIFSRLLNQLKYKKNQQKIENVYFNSRIAKCLFLQELRIIFCKHVTWQGFASFLDFCPVNFLLF